MENRTEKHLSCGGPVPGRYGNLVPSSSFSSPFSHGYFCILCLTAGANNYSNSMNQSSAGLWASDTPLSSPRCDWCGQCVSHQDGKLMGHLLPEMMSRGRRECPWSPFSLFEMLVSFQKRPQCHETQDSVFNSQLIIDSGMLRFNNSSDYSQWQASASYYTRRDLGSSGRMLRKKLWPSLRPSRR